MDVKTQEKMETFAAEDLGLSVDWDANAQETPYVFFFVGDKAYGVSSELVLSMHTMEGCTPIVDFPEHIRGVVDFRGQAIPLCDLRKLFHLSSAADELADFLSERIDDHRRWIEELEQSVRNRTPFMLTTDPHQCAFGKWYDSYQTDNSALRVHLQKINKPHCKVHEAGIEAKKCMESGDYDGAMQLVSQVKSTHFKEIIELLTEASDIYRAGNREIVIVLEYEDKVFGVIVDNIISVEPIAELIAMPEGTTSEYVTRIAKRSKEPHMVLLLDCAKL